MSATLIVRHTVADYGTWREAYESAGPVRAKYGCTDQQVLQLPSDPNDVAATHAFPSVEQAEAFAADPELRAAMDRGGVTAAPRIEIFQNV
jgi:hypothetical protein